MQTVKVKRTELLDKVTANRAAHRGIFEKACEGYRKAAVAELENMLSEAKAGKRIRRSVALVEPMDQTKEYDSAITMLTMSVDDVIELQQHEFSQYVMDDWGWKDAFTATSMRYVP